MHATTLVKAIGRARVDGPTVIAVAAKSSTATKTSAGTVDFRDYLRKLMLENGYERPTDLARAADMDPSNLSRWLGGTTGPSVDVLRRIAPHLNVRLGDLMIRAGMASAAELGTIGSPPPPRAPLPAQVQRVVSRWKDPRIPERHKRALLNVIDRAVDLWEEMREPVREPQMRRR